MSDQSSGSISFLGFRLTPLKRGLLILAAGCLALALLSCVAYGVYFKIRSASQPSPLTYLKAEFEDIPPMMGSIVRHQGSLDKLRQGHVGAQYTTAENPQTVRWYYQRELEKRGWKFVREEEVLYNRRDYGGQHLFFCKNKYTADLQFAGKQEQQFGWTYSFSLSWGIYDNTCS